MKLLVYAIACSLLLTTSCATLNKKTNSQAAQNSESNIPGTNSKKTTVQVTTQAPKPTQAPKTTLAPATPIREVKEKLVTENERTNDTKKYFGIVGSFSNFNNALKQQMKINAKGFTSEILKNYSGLYRISVKATDNIDEARTEIRRIRAQYPEYSDAWMLVMIK
jgi:cell division protein FtsN